MASRIDDKKQPRCSFCNKTQDQVKKLIAGPNGAYICDECVGICADILDEEFENEEDIQEDPVEVPYGTSLQHLQLLYIIITREYYQPKMSM